jgi:hypothetical protein
VCWAPHTLLALLLVLVSVLPPMEGWICIAQCMSVDGSRGQGSSSMSDLLADLLDLELHTLLDAILADAAVTLERDLASPGQKLEKSRRDLVFDGS